MHGLEAILPSVEVISYAINLAVAASLACGVGLFSGGLRVPTRLDAIATRDFGRGDDACVTFARSRLAGRTEGPDVGSAHDFRSDECACDLDCR